MSFFRFLRAEMRSALPWLLVMSCLAGLSNAAILAIVNAAAQTASGQAPDPLSALGFVVLVATFIKAQHFILITANTKVEEIVRELRLRILDHVRRSELLALDTIGPSAIVSALTKDTAALTQAAHMLAYGAQSLVLVFFVSIYIASQSALALCLIIVIIALVGVLFRSQNRLVAIEAKQSQEWDRRFLDRLTDLLRGFKEVRLNRARSDALMRDIVDVSGHATSITIRTQNDIFWKSILGQGSLYVLLGVILFVLPVLGRDLGGAVARTTTALLFTIGSCLGLLQSVPILSGANAAADHLRELEAWVAAGVGPARPGAVNSRARFSRIVLRKMVFRYRDTSDYQIGPIDFTLSAGDVVFISGGNGSGKSTFLKVLSGLYWPRSGEIILDDAIVEGGDARDSYRRLFSAVFAEYHLFPKPYGIPDGDPPRFDSWLTEFQLDKKVQIIDGAFSTLDLSTGQRKRLALVVSLMEERPILLLDEWTANQDPEFRRKFYIELVPALHRAGITLVMVTQDEQYFDSVTVPFHRIRMDSGRFASDRT